MNIKATARDIVSTHQAARRDLAGRIKRARKVWRENIKGTPGESALSLKDFVKIASGEVTVWHTKPTPANLRHIAHGYRRQLKNMGITWRRDADSWPCGHQDHYSWKMADTRRYWRAYASAAARVQNQNTV